MRWVNEANVHTSTAYHPANDGHSLRIPTAAEPWDSGYLVEPGDQFEIILTVPGVYDYFCTPHEMAGMVGRIIVGEPSGPGALPFDYFQGDPAAQGWSAVPPPAQAAFPADRADHERARGAGGGLTFVARPTLPQPGPCRQAGPFAAIRSGMLDVRQFL